VSGSTPPAAPAGPGGALVGSLGVAAAARQVRHYRYAEERLMRVLAGWIALTPELPAKLLLGRQVWECAQHADQWGRRLPELRAPAHGSEPPDPAFARFLDVLESRQAWGETIERLVGVYRVAKPHLAAAYARHLELASAVHEAPTRRILERCLADERRHVAEGEAALATLLATAGARARATAWESELRALLAGSAGLARELGAPAAGADDAGAGGVEAARAGAERAAIAADALPPWSPSADAGGAAGPAELEAAVRAHATRVVARDPRAREDVAPGAQLAPPDLLDRLLGATLEAAELVAHARLGAHHVYKTRFNGPVTFVVQARWAAEGDGRWRIREAEVARVAGDVPGAASGPARGAEA
jgi:hypothetical protein